MATKPAKPAPAAAAAAKPKNNKLMIIVAVVALLVAGAAGWFFTKGDAPKDKDKAHAEAEAEEAAPSAEPKFIALEPFTVNLQQEEGEQFLQIGITLKVTDLKLEEKIKLHLPEIRSRLLLLLSSKRASELVPAEGKVKLAQEVIMETESALGIAAPHAPETATPTTTQAASKASGRVDVLFTSFIIQ